MNVMARKMQAVLRPARSLEILLLPDSDTKAVIRSVHRSFTSGQTDREPHHQVTTKEGKARARRGLRRMTWPSAWRLPALHAILLVVTGSPNMLPMRTLHPCRQWGSVRNCRGSQLSDSRWGVLKLRGGRKSMKKSIMVDGPSIPKKLRATGGIRKSSHGMLQRKAVSKPIPKDTSPLVIALLPITPSADSMSAIRSIRQACGVIAAVRNHFVKLQHAHLRARHGMDHHSCHFHGDSRILFLLKRPEFHIPHDFHINVPYSVPAG